MPMPIADKSLQELDGQDWGEPPDDSHLIRTSHELRHKKLGDFTAEDLRLLIGQNLCLDVLMPVAIHTLEANPLASGDYYEGDLLNTVLTADAVYWKQHPNDYHRVRQLLSDLDITDEDVPDFQRARDKFIRQEPKPT